MIELFPGEIVTKADPEVDVTQEGTTQGVVLKRLAIRYRIRWRAANKEWVSDHHASELKRTYILANYAQTYQEAKNAQH